MGTTVERIQARLIELGYLQGVASGTFDAATTQAVKAFQSVVGVRARTAWSPTLLYSQLIASDAYAPRGRGHAERLHAVAGGRFRRRRDALAERAWSNWATPTARPTASTPNATVSAVRLFQRAAGREEETGVATAGCRPALLRRRPAYTASTPAASRRPLLSLRASPDRPGARVLGRTGELFADAPCASLNTSPARWTAYTALPRPPPCAPCRPPWALSRPARPAPPSQGMSIPTRCRPQAYPCAIPSSSRSRWKWATATWKMADHGPGGEPAKKAALELWLSGPRSRAAARRARFGT